MLLSVSLKADMNACRIVPDARTVVKHLSIVPHRVPAGSARAGLP